MVKVPYQYVWSRHNISPRMLWRNHLMTDESEENQGEVKVDDEDVELDEGGALKELQDLRRMGEFSAAEWLDCL